MNDWLIGKILIYNFYSASFLLQFTFRSLQVEEENLKARREQLRYKEEGLKDIEKRYEERLQNEIIKYFYND